MSARVSGVGSMPGDDVVEAVRVVLGELGEPPGLPHLPELPARGAGATMVGRAAALCTELGFDLQPAGWRLTGSAEPGLDQRRARSLLGQDLDALEEQAQGYRGELKVQVTGPWTLAASVERPRGDRVLADHGARRDLAQAMAAGVADHLADVRRRLPGATVVLQVDEPALPAVLAARVPTASGFGRHRSVAPPEASETLSWVLGLTDATVVHCCAADVPVDLLRGAGAGALSVDLAVLAPAAYDGLATALEAGERVHLGVVPAVADEVPPVRSVVDRVRSWLDMLGLDPEEVAERLVLTPACGTAGASAAYARAVLGRLREVAGEVG